MATRADFDETYATKRWTDYVVYGKDPQTNRWLIINVIYGDEFH
ncbi:hypothetical protein [Ligilactobacillus equi]|nr:hypothetical protein [Ligilactobacillus equi]